MELNDGQAIVENDAIVIRVPFSVLPQVVEGGWALGCLGQRYKVTDAALFAKELVRELGREDEQGTTPVHRLFDEAISEALESGAEGIEEHEDQAG